jgi:hypothetical protein
LRRVRNALSPASAPASANAPTNATTDNDGDIQMEETDGDPDSPSTRRAHLAHAIPTTVTLRKAREEGVIVRQHPPERT